MVEARLALVRTVLNVFLVISLLAWAESAHGSSDTIVLTFQYNVHKNKTVNITATENHNNNVTWIIPSISPDSGNITYGEYNSTEIMFSAPTEQTTRVPPEQFSSWYITFNQVRLDLKWYTVVVVSPTVAVLGLTGNVLSLVVISRIGLRKASNIFILALAIADCCCLLEGINVAGLLRFFTTHLDYYIWEDSFWEFPPPVALACFVITAFTDALNFYGMNVSSGVCTIITVERFLAVFFPLRFTRIITPLRAWIIVVIIFIFWFPYHLHGAIVGYEFEAIYVPRFQAYFGSGDFNLSWVHGLIDFYVLGPIGKIIPIIVILTGSILIGVRVGITQRQRRKLTSGFRSKNSRSEWRLTKSLLAVCIIFCVTKALALWSHWGRLIPYQNARDFTVLLFLLHYSFNTLEFVNSSCNFLIYVWFNNNFRSELKKMWRCARETVDVSVKKRKQKTGSEVNSGKQLA